MLKRSQLFKRRSISSMAFPSVFWITFMQFFFAIIITNNSRCNGQNVPKFSALFAFGDSAFDTGNNNYINSICRGNYPPYGIHFPGGIPTGRISDGKLIPDLVASALGIKELLPPFLQPNLPDHELLTGVCFASAGAGLDDQTTAISNAIPLSKQPGYLQDYIERLTNIVGRLEAERIVNEALVIIHIGTVDFLYHFDIMRTNRRVQFTVDEYQDFLLHNLQNFLKKLYYLGCRNIIVSGLPPLGCLPFTLTANSPISRTCIEHMNSEAQSYNDKLSKMLQQLMTQLPGSKIFYGDTYNPLLDMIKHPQKYGFVETSRGCCGTGQLEMGPFCTITPLCRNSSQYLFFDTCHPTETAFRYLLQYVVGEIFPKFT